MYFDRFDICSAWYIWLTVNHGGQGSPEYVRLSRLLSHFAPRGLVRAADLGENARAIYDQIEAK